jgi:hypothetical protein
VEKGLWYVIVFMVNLVLLIAGSIRKKFHLSKLLVSVIAVLFIPGLAAAFISGLQLLASRNEIWLPLLLGSLAGGALYHVIFKRLYGFSTFEHELSHVLVALLFFRRIKKFVVTRHNGGYIQYSEGFGGTVGNYFISLGPYFLPTFTLFSVLMRPFLPETWFPAFDVWIGITFSYQLMNNVDEIKNNWTKKRFSPAGKGSLLETDIGKEGYIFSFILILALKLLILSMLMYILVNDYSGVPDVVEVIWKNSISFFKPVFAEIMKIAK